MKKIFIVFFIVFCVVLIGCQAEEITQPDPPAAEDPTEEPVEEPAEEPAEEPVYEVVSFKETEKFPWERTMYSPLPRGASPEMEKGRLWQKDRYEENGKVIIDIENQSPLFVSIKAWIFDTGKSPSELFAEIDLETEIEPNKSYELIFIWHGELPQDFAVLIIPKR